MRIIGGSLGKRHIKTPAGLPVRPTTDKAKEALFSILNNHVCFDDIKVLDLFAGTGSISYEFASRGALEVVAVDNNIRCIRFMQKTKHEFALDNLSIIKTDALRFIDLTTNQFDVIFCDPPYDLPRLSEIPDRILNTKILQPDTIIVVEHPANIVFDSHEKFSFKKNYSKVHFSFFITR